MHERSAALLLGDTVTPNHMPISTSSWSAHHSEIPRSHASHTSAVSCKANRTINVPKNDVEPPANMIILPTLVAAE